MDEIEYWLKSVRMLLPVFAICMVDRKVDELKFLHHQRRENLTDSFEKNFKMCRIFVFRRDKNKIIAI